MTESLATAVEENVASIDEMSRSVQAVASNGRRIMDIAAGAANSATQMERSTESVASLARRADDVTTRAARDAQDGGETIQRSIRGLGRMREAMVQSSSVMREMGKRAGDIGSIVDTINLIAERTNLLSLNASIEAARAGDAGRGFAVVAEEIRNLADRSAKATADIAAIIRALQEVSQEAVVAASDGLRVADESNVLAENGASGLSKILGGLSEATTIVAQIARATEEQKGAAQSVSNAIAATAEQVKQVATATAEQATTAGSIVQATGSMRKIAQEVAKAVNEQSRAARDVIKAAQATTKLAGQVRKATDEQTRTVGGIGQAVDSMRRGAAATVRALSEQATAADQVSRSSELFTRQAAHATRAMSEQATQATQIAASIRRMRQEAQETSKALAEQNRTMKGMTTATANTSAQIALISQANRERSEACAGLAGRMKEIRNIAERNAAGVKATRGSTGQLVSRAKSLRTLVARASARPGGDRPPRPSSETG
jgi:methyl-accepting chemotaxis protein